MPILKDIVASDEFDAAVVKMAAAFGERKRSERDPTCVRPRDATFVWSIEMYDAYNDNIAVEYKPYFNAMVETTIKWDYNHNHDGKFGDTYRALVKELDDNVNRKVVWAKYCEMTSKRRFKRDYMVGFTVRKHKIGEPEPANEDEEYVEFDNGRAHDLFAILLDGDWVAYDDDLHMARYDALHREVAANAHLNPPPEYTALAEIKDSGPRFDEALLKWKTFSPPHRCTVVVHRAEKGEMVHR